MSCFLLEHNLFIHNLILDVKKTPESIYVSLGFEGLLSTIYGTSGHSSHAGHTEISSWKKHLLQVFRTLKTAIRKNVTGDDRYKEQLMTRCDCAISAITNATFKDKIACDALSFSFEIAFALLGRLPDNRRSRRAHHTHVTNLGDYRTLSYSRTASQKARQITDSAHKNCLNETEPSFETLISTLRRDFHDDADRFLTWFRQEHPDLYGRFH